MIFEIYHQNHRSAILELQESLKEEDDGIFLLVVQDVLLAFDGDLPEDIHSELIHLYAILAENEDLRIPLMGKLFKAFHLEIPATPLNRDTVKLYN